MGLDQSFKVIIAGGSVVGLTLANALEKAGIDFLVLDRGDIAPQLGASISIYTPASKVLDQLGVWEVIRQSASPFLSRQHFDEHGRLFEENEVLRLIYERTKRPVMFLERSAYLLALYNNLEDKSRARGHVGVASYAEDEDGVTVSTTTGEEIRGSILVGADGIHSTVRKLMAGSVAKSDPQRAKKLNEGFTAHYRTIFGTSKNQRGDDPGKPLLAEGLCQDVFHRGFSGISANTVSGLVFWFLFVKEDEPSTTPNCPRYSEADAENTLRKYGHFQLGPGYTFNDLWERRIKAAMVPLEEGVLEGSWNSGGRVVLLGDSVSKVTINAGLGGNTNVEGICHLVNELLPVLKETRNPGKQEIKGVFDRYEAKQRPRADACVRLSGFITRLEAMDTWWYRLLRVISPWIPDSLKLKVFLDMFAGAPVLDFLPDPDKKSST